jgi:hypothetical protein
LQVQRHDDAFAGFDQTAGAGELFHHFTIGDDDLGEQAGGGAGDQVQVEVDQGLPGLNLLALLHQRHKAFTLEHDGVDADMDQHFDTVVRGDGQRMVCGMNIADVPLTGASSEQEVGSREMPSPTILPANTGSGTVSSATSHPERGPECPVVARESPCETPQELIATVILLRAIVGAGLSRNSARKASA